MTSRFERFKALPLSDRTSYATPSLAQNQALLQAQQQLERLKKTQAQLHQLLGHLEKALVCETAEGKNFLL